MIITILKCHLVYKIIKKEMIIFYYHFFFYNGKTAKYTAVSPVPKIIK